MIQVIKNRRKDSYILCFQQLNTKRVLGSVDLQFNGKYDFLPSTNRHIESFLLRLIADKIDQMNKDWENETEETFKKKYNDKL